MEYYSRQIRLPGIGIEGQALLSNARCLVVGAGGLGAPALQYLAAAGVGTIGICDGDRLEESNLHRQPLYSQLDIGEKKAELARIRLTQLNPHIRIVSHPFQLDATNALSLFSSYDLALDCTDNFTAKFLLNDASFLNQKPLIRSSIYQFEGQIQTYIPSRQDACLRCMWEEPPEEGCVGTCQQVGVVGPVPGFFGVLQAMEAIKLILKMPTLGSGDILFTDLIHYQNRRIQTRKRPTCPLCGTSPTIFTIHADDSIEQESKHLDRPEIQWIDIREPFETSQDPYAGPHIQLPLSTFDPTLLDPNRSYALFCQSGRRSRSLTERLREQGFTRVYSVLGGMNALSQKSRS